MNTYIGKVEKDIGDVILIGSTLYGTCTSAKNVPEKVVTLSNFDNFLNGVTIHVRFTKGNSILNNVVLKVGNTDLTPVIGNCICNENDIIAFTCVAATQNNVTTYTWYVNNNLVVAEGTQNGQIKINGQQIAIHGLDTAAYESSLSFATAQQGVLAEAAMPKSGGTFTGPVILNSAPTVALEAATKKYVDDHIGGLTSAMRFRGAVNEIPPETGIFEAGDVVLLKETQKEYVYDNINWIELGDEGSYVLRNSQTTTTIDTITSWQDGTNSSAIIEDGILCLTNSIIPTLSTTEISIIIPNNT